jgi:hypothetical protein
MLYTFALPPCIAYVVSSYWCKCISMIDNLVGNVSGYYVGKCVGKPLG